MAIFSSIIKQFLGGYATHVEMVSVTKDIIHVSFGTMNPLECTFLCRKKRFYSTSCVPCFCKTPPCFWVETWLWSKGMTDCCHTRPGGHTATFHQCSLRMKQRKPDRTSESAHMHGLPTHVGVRRLVWFMYRTTSPTCFSGHVVMLSYWFISKAKIKLPEGHEGLEGWTSQVLFTVRLFLGRKNCFCLWNGQ